MDIATKPKRHLMPRVTSGAVYSSINLDSQSRSRMIHAAHLINTTLDVPANGSTVVRIGLEMYLRHLEEVCRKLAMLPEGSAERAALLEHAQNVVFKANQAGAHRRPK